MAAENCRKRFQQEATCPVCLGYFASPVMLECGHSFCENCILRCWEESDVPSRCPQCRRPVGRDFGPNRCLLNLVEILSDWDASAEREARGLTSECQRHQQPLSLFCKEDCVPLCVECGGSQEHLGHDLAPAEEAAQEYKAQVRTYMEILRQAKENILEYRENTEVEREDMTDRTQSQRRKLTTHFRQFHKFLEEQEKLLQGQIDEVEKEIERRKDEHLVRLSKELFRLDSLIEEMEEKVQQPASQLLEDIQSTLRKYKERQTFEMQEVYPPELKFKTCEFLDVNLFIQEVMKQFTDGLGAGLPLQKVNLTLDPYTPNSILTVSEDQKSMRRRAKSQDPPAKRQKFDPSSIVLGVPALTAGRHCWDVTLENEELWGMGVVRQSAVEDISEFIRRKGCFKANSKKGIWALKSPSGSCLARQSARLLCVKNLKKVRVTLNYPGRRVAFFNLDRGQTVWACTEASSSGEPLVPFFWLGPGAHLTLSP